jgi:hypothetical protein
MQPEGSLLCSQMFSICPYPEPNNSTPDFHYIVTYLGGVTINGFGLVNWFIDNLYTRLGTTSNYSAIANLHNSEIATAKPFFQPFVS